MTVKFAIERRYLKAVQCFTTNNPERDALHSVSLELELEKQICRLIATDGTCLGTIEAPIKAISNEPLPGVHQMALDVSPLRFLPRKKLPDTLLTLHFDLKPDGSAGELKEVYAENLQFKENQAVRVVLPIGPEYPKWRQVVPDKIGDEPDKFSFSCRVLDRFQKAANILCGDLSPAIRLVSTGQLKAWAVFMPNATEFFGLAMPVQDERVYNTIPKWIK